MRKHVASIVGIACLLLWLNIVDTYALSREAAVYNISHTVATTAIIVLGLSILVGNRLSSRRRAVRVGTCAIATIAGAGGFLFPALIPVTFPLFAACIVPMAICWGRPLAHELVVSRCRIVCTAGILSSIAGLAYSLLSDIAWIGAVMPLASCVCLRFANLASSSEAHGENAASPVPGRLPRGHRLFMYTVCICTLLASVMCGMIASPVTANSQTPSLVMAAVCTIGLALLLAATGPASKAAAKATGHASPDLAFAQLQVFGGLFEVVFVVGLVLLSTAQAGTMTTSVGIIIGARLCMAGICWIMLPAGARADDGEASASRLAALLAGCGIVFGTYAGAELDRLNNFTFEQLTNITTACIAIMAVIAVLYATMRARGLMPAPQAGGEASARDGAGADAGGGAGADAGASVDAGARVGVGGGAGADAGSAAECEPESAGSEAGADAGADASAGTSGKATSTETAAKDENEAAGAARGEAPGDMASPAVNSLSLKQQIKAMRLAQISPFGLTERETQIVLLLLDGQTMRGIAEELFITERTVKFHSKNAYTKLGVTSKKELMQKFSDLPGESAEEPLRPQG